MKRDTSITTCLAVLLTVVLATVGCSTDETTPQREVDRDADADEARAGTLLAEYAQPREGRAGGLSVHAQFIDVQGVSYDEALAALEVWYPDWNLSSETCDLREEPSISQTEADDIRMELLDVGPIDVRGPNEAIELQARRIPDLLSSFSGVIYGTDRSYEDRPLRLGFEPGARYDFDAPGTRHSGDFAVSLHSPQPVRIESIGHRPITDDARRDWDFDTDLTVQWRPEPDDRNADALFLHLSSGFGPDRPSMTCRLEDDGSFAIPGPLLEQLSAESNELDLALRRVNTESVDIDGLETSEFVFSTVDEVTIVDR
ncbi:MAG: hypothetical protein ACOCV2_15125 [Persicimonas sp.]